MFCGSIQPIVAIEVCFSLSKILCSNFHLMSAFEKTRYISLIRVFWSL